MLSFVVIDKFQVAYAVFRLLFAPGYTNIYIYELHVAFHDCVPNLISNLEILSGSLPSNLIVIFSGFALRVVLGEKSRGSNLNIWCSMAALQCIFCLLAAKGLVLMRLV